MMRLRLWLLLIGLACVVLLATVPLPHMDSDAPLYGRIAANVLVTGDWISFHHPGWHVDKPPIVFWAMAGSFKLLGISDVTLRLWQVLLAVLMVGLVAATARAAGCGREEAALAALILATALQFFYQTMVPQQDVPLTFFLTLAAYGLLQYLRQPATGWAVLTAAAVALAVLTKGVAGLAMFGVVAGLAVPVGRAALALSWRRLLGHAALTGVVFVLLAVPWFAVGIWRGGEQFVSTFFTTGTLGVGRFFTPAISTPPPYWLSVFAYVPLLFLGLLPWSPIFVLSLTGLPAEWRRGPIGVRVVAVWFLALFVLLSLSSGDKVFRYLLPVFPPAAILAGRTATRLFTDPGRLRLAGSIAVAPTVALIAAGFWMVWTQFPPERALLLAVVLPTVAGLGLGLILFGVAAVRGRGPTAVALAAAGALVGLALFSLGMRTHASAINPWPAITAAARPLEDETDRLVLMGRAADGFNFAHFYFTRPVVAVRSASEIAALWQRERVLVVLDDGEYEAVARLLSPPPRIVYRSPTRLTVISNHTGAPEPPRTR